MIGTKIFFINSIALFLTLFVCTFIGHIFSFCCPHRLRPSFNLFLSPAMGMAFLILVTCLLGRFFPFNHTVFLSYSFIIALVVISLTIASDKKKLIQYAVTVGLFGLLCGLPLLLELFFYGGYNSHNDAFTYLAISDWLQSHAFNQTITPQTITPAFTQPSMYQIMGFRMGGSYFMGFLQAIFHVKWAYTIYPTAVLTPIAVCCLAMGFPIFLSIMRIKRWIQLSVLALPALCLGSLSFAMLYGFMAQIFGLAMGSAALFWYGGMLSNLRNTAISWKKQLIFAIPLAFFFSACTVSYSEISVFIFLAILLSTILFMIKNRVFSSYIIYGAFVSILSILFINFELPRVIASSITQSQAVVGSPIDWPWFGYVFHMIGLHGGGWDIFQWSMHPPIKITIIAAALLLSFAMIFWKNKKQLKLALLKGTWLPSALVLCLFILGIIYFRYFVANPFSVGRGQSWSQFKLSEWAFPFAFAFLLTNFLMLYRGSSRILKSLVGTILLLACLLVISTAKQRMEPITSYYIGVRNLDQFYQNARQLILETCPKNAPIYLDLINGNHKFRQMLSLYLTDRKIKSDWTGDGYIINTLPENQRIEPVQLGDCLIQAFSNNKNSKSTTLDIMNVSVVHGDEPIQLEAIEKTYDQEHDDQDNTWYWVESSIKFKPISLLKGTTYKQTFTHTQLKFQYATRILENLFIHVKAKNGHVFVFKIHSNNSKGNYFTFQKTLSLPVSQIAELDIQADGVATPLGKNDPRKVSWIIRNITMTPEK